MNWGESALVFIGCMACFWTGHWEGRRFSKKGSRTAGYGVAHLDDTITLCRSRQHAERAVAKKPGSRIIAWRAT